jgi:DNA-binding transcriptional LysR family regulator
MDIRQLRYFAATVEEGSLQGAAQRLRVAQPALSRRIQDLEADLGCALLVRGSRGITPTAAGTTLYGDAVQLLAGFDQASRRARRVGTDQAGIVRLGLMPGSRKYPFAQQVVAGHVMEHSNENVALTRAASAELVTALRSGGLDLALLYERHLGSAEFGERLIHRERYVLAAHPAHRLAAAAPFDLTELAGERLIWLSRHDTEGEQDRLLQSCRLHGLEPLVAHTARTHEEQLDLTVITSGLCLTPASTSLAVAPGQLVFRPIPQFSLDLPFSLVWSHGMTASCGVALLARFHRAIDEHQERLRRGEIEWSRLYGHDIVEVDEPAPAS